MNPEDWRAAVEAIQRRKEREKQQARQRHEIARLKARERVERGQASPIDAMNAEFSLEDMMANYGYEKHGDRWLSPLSESGQPGVIITEDGQKWISSHGSDAVAGLGRECSGGRMGDQFDLYCYFEHGGDHSAALRGSSKLLGLGMAIPSEFPDLSGTDNRLPTGGREEPELGRLANLKAFMSENGVLIDREMLAKEYVGADFIWDRYTARKMVTLLVSMGGLGKSQLAIYVLLCLAAGYDPTNPEKRIPKRRVLLVTLEDPLEVVLDRLKKAIKGLADVTGVPEERIREAVTAQNFSILPLYGTEFSVASPTIGGAVMITPDLGLLKHWIAEKMPNGVDQIAIDTLVRSHQANENDNIAMAKVMVSFEQLARDTDASVELLAHVPKAAVGERGSHVARGAGAITDNARSSMNLTPATADDVKTFSNVEPEWTDPESPRLLRLTHAKSNYGPKAQPAWFLLKGGWLEPFAPAVSKMSTDERLYRALYNWWTQKHASKPFTKTTAEDALADIKTFDGSFSKGKLRALITWAVAVEHAVAVDLSVVSTEGITVSKNPDTVYYRLRPLPEGPAG